MERLKLVIAGLSALGMLVGCGGNTNRNGSQGAGGNATAGTDSGAAATGSAGKAPIMSLDSFETGDRFVSIGLWMGFPDGTLPIGTPPNPHDGSALHLVGKTNEDGLDVFFHTGIPVERIWSSVRFWTQSDLPSSFLTVAIAGPEQSYFTDRAQGLAWPQQLVRLGSDWQEVVVDFKALHLDPDHLSPHSENFGAVHFIIEPDTHYDLWIDDFAGQPL